MREVAEKKDYLTYNLNGITYLPHYQNSNLYIGPGYPRHNKNIYKPDDLLAVGAKAVMLHIWKRMENGIPTELLKKIRV